MGEQTPPVGVTAPVPAAAAVCLGQGDGGSEHAACTVRAPVPTARQGAKEAMRGQNTTKTKPTEM